MPTDHLYDLIGGRIIKCHGETNGSDEIWVRTNDGRTVILSTITNDLTVTIIEDE